MAASGPAARRALAGAGAVGALVNAAAGSHGPAAGSGEDAAPVAAEAADAVRPAQETRAETAEPVEAVISMEEHSRRIEAALLAAPGGSNIGPSLVVHGDRHGVCNGRIACPFGDNKLGFLLGVLPGGGDRFYFLSQRGCERGQGETEGEGKRGIDAVWGLVSATCGRMSTS